jgi:hypothetical protein
MHLSDIAFGILFNFINLFLDQSGQGTMIFLVDAVFINESLCYLIWLWIDLSLNLFFASTYVYWDLERLLLFFFDRNLVESRITANSLTTLVQWSFQRLFSSKALIWRCHLLTFLESWWRHRLIRLESIFITILHQFLFIVSQISLVILVVSVSVIMELIPFIMTKGRRSLR